MAIVVAASGRVATSTAPQRPRASARRERSFGAASSSAKKERRAQDQTPRKKATSIPLQNDQASTPTPSITGGRRNDSARMAPRSARRSATRSKSIRATSSVPNTLTMATMAAQRIRSSSRKPTSQPSARTNGYVRLVLPDE